MPEGGCLFMLEGAEKIRNFIKDEFWIKAVKDLAKLQLVEPQQINWIVELHRADRSGNEKTYDKCFSKVKELIPDFVFHKILLPSDIFISQLIKDHSPMV